jgi:hypothetical protein
VLAMRIKALNLMIFIAFLLAWHGLFSFFKLYHSRRLTTRQEDMRQIFKAVSLGTLVLLLAEAIHRTVLIAEQAGLIGLFVDAKDERVHKFYERYGFASLPGHALQLFLPLETLRLAERTVVLKKSPTRFLEKIERP